MENRRTVYLNNFLAATALILSLAVLQGPLSRPGGTSLHVTATAGGTAILSYNGEIEMASIFQKRTATLSADSPGRLIIHGHVPGKTSLLIRFKRGDSKLYDVIVLPG